MHRRHHLRKEYTVLKRQSTWEEYKNIRNKLWKARLHGYEEVTRLFRSLDTKSPEFLKYEPLVPKFVEDSNEKAQEKGLEAVLAYIECCASADRTVGGVMRGIVNKCIAATSVKTKELAIDVTLICVEIGKQKLVQDVLMKGMEGKSLNVTSACVSCLTRALREFGSKTVSIKPLLKKISALLNDRDRRVRDEGKKMVVEIYRWEGGTIEFQLDSLQPIQVRELMAEFEKVGKDRAVPTRYIHLKQQRQTMFVNEGGGAAGNGVADEVDEAVCEPQIDPYDLMEPVDILSQLPQSFYKKLKAKKFQDRKKPLLDLVKILLHAPKLKDGNYGDLIQVLNTIISKDASKEVVAVAGKFLAALVDGLKKNFSPYASACVPGILAKFKENREDVVTVLTMAIDAIYQSSSIESVQADVLAALNSENTSVKRETASFLARCFTCCTRYMLNEKVLETYCVTLLKTLDDPDPTVHDCAADALGTAMKVVGEKTMAPLIADLDDIKMTKIKVCCEREVIVANTSL